MSRKNSNRNDELAGQIHSAAIHLLRRLRREDAGSGLNAARLSALSVLVLAGVVRLGARAAAEQGRPPTMTRIANALVEMGLVERRGNARDGRSTLISATEKGKALMLAGRDRRVQALARQLAEVGMGERETLEKAMTILAGVIAKI